MCGICGIIYFNSDNSVTKELLHNMCEQIKHRGPDDEGLYVSKDKSTGLGMRRLAIIDLVSGQQPIYNEDKSLCVVCNGEIYNYKSLRDDLENKGHTFYTHSDVEVIPHLYEEYQVDCVKYLRGMFAFALYDSRQKQVLLARDRVGQKPLCYCVHNNSFMFASEIKSLFANSSLEPEVNMEALHAYLTYGYIPSPMTMFKGVFKLPPASTMLCGSRGKCDISRYWDLSYQEKIQVGREISVDQLCEEIISHLREAVRLRLISDVPLGAFLSGGLDSSIIVGLMTQLMDKPVKTFSVGFQEQDFNELSYARIIARHFGTEHNEFIVKPNALEILPELIWHYNEPFADSSSIPSYYVAYQTRKFVTVALNGDGGDENFAGYLRYKANKLAQMIASIYIKCGGKFLFQFIKNLPESSHQKDVFRRLKRFLRALDTTEARRNILWHCFFDNNMKKELYTDGINEQFKNIDSFAYMEDTFNKASADKFLDKILYTDVKTYLPEDLLVKIDIATMANSLEARSPFLDHKFMEFTARIQPSIKLKGLTGKWILKQSVKDMLPKRILTREKMGFGMPIGKWLRNELKDYMCDILLDKNSLQRGYFNKKALTTLIEEHVLSRHDHGYRLWSLLNLELWHQMFIDKNSELRNFNS